MLIALMTSDRGRDDRWGLDLAIFGVRPNSHQNRNSTTRLGAHARQVPISAEISVIEARAV